MKHPCLDPGMEAAALSVRYHIAGEPPDGGESVFGRVEIGRARSRAVGKWGWVMGRGRGWGEGLQDGGCRIVVLTT